MRTVGCAPADRCRSEARRETTSINRSAKSMDIGVPIGSVRAGTRQMSPPWTTVRSRVGARSCRSDHPRALCDRGPPQLGLLEAVPLEPPHALGDGDLQDLVRGPALDRELADLG